MIVTLAIAVVMSNGGDSVATTLVPTGAVSKVGGYIPIRCNLTNDDKGIKKKPEGLTKPQYGTLSIADKSFAIIYDGPKLYVDTNGDGDLTNDPAATWALDSRKMYGGNAKVDIGKESPVSVNFYKFDPDDPSRAALKDVVLYYLDYGYQLTLPLDGQTLQGYIVGEPADKARFAVDRNGDKKMSNRLENFVVGKPFNITGTTYVVEFANGALNLSKSDEKVDKMPLPPDHAIGKKATPFSMVGLDGKKISFPNDYKGKIVMLDFWATWCGPCIAELPNVKAAYAKWHTQGFEILGISFDQANMTDKVKEFTEKNGMPWKHLYEGKYWDTTIGMTYDVSGIPYVLLVDGDTGEILADARQLRGEQIVDTIGKALAKKKGQ